MELVSLAEFMPEQSDGAIGERFESLAIRERPVTIVAFYTQFARVDLHPGVEIDHQFIHVRCNAADESPCVLCDLGEPSQVLSRFPRLRCGRSSSPGAGHLRRPPAALTRPAVQG